jgi:hypothetical protein
LQIAPASPGVNHAPAQRLDLLQRIGDYIHPRHLTETHTLTRRGLTAFTVTNHDNSRGPDGEWLRVRGLYHVTRQDKEPFGPSPNDVVRTEFTHFSFGCSWAEGISG